jgi:hypothetical protein
MKVIIPEKKLEEIAFKYLDKIFENLERSKGKDSDIVFKYHGKEYGVIGWEKMGNLWVYDKFVNNISSIIPIEKTKILKIISRYIKDRYKLEVDCVMLLNNKSDYMLKIDRI